MTEVRPEVNRGQTEVKPRLYRTLTKASLLTMAVATIDHSWQNDQYWLSRGQEAETRPGTRRGQEAEEGYMAGVYPPRVHPSDMPPARVHHVRQCQVRAGRGPPAREGLPVPPQATPTATSTRLLSGLVSASSPTRPRLSSRQPTKGNPLIIPRVPYI